MITLRKNSKLLHTAINRICMRYTLLSAIILLSCSMTALATSVIKSSSPADPGVINTKQIIYWLQKRGQLALNATDSEKQQAIKTYLGNKSFEPKPVPGEFARKFMSAQQRAFMSNSRLKPKRLTKVSSQIAQSSPTETEAKILVVMIDFSDHEAEQSAYPASHYNDLVFSKPDLDGEIKSAYQYYHQESGGTMKLTGDVFGWVRAENSAASYGENDPDNDDSDKDVPALVLEAVTKVVAEHSVDLSDYDLDNDGIIDHVMIFHSSVGEEAGGGELGEDAIWSHRYFVFDEQNMPVNIPGSEIKLFGYTINPVDARLGVVAHEFGHDLGVPDEYDIGRGTYGSPVGNWSIMASGSWVDSGSHPSGFSPYAKDYFQSRYGGNWINQQEIDFSILDSESVNLVTATNHAADEINQVKVNLPAPQLMFGAPYAGDFQFYSSRGHNLTSTLSFDVTLPAGSSALAMKARWDIETDWDYIQISVNDTVISGNHTKENNPIGERSDVHNYISGASRAITTAEGELGWVDLIFDLSTYENQSVSIKISYITDTYEAGYGFVADEINVTNSGTLVFEQGAESSDKVHLAGGFSRITTTRDGEPHHYYVQLRNHTKTDTYLADIDYDPGVLVWYANTRVDDNRVNDHPGEVFIGVVDADQHAIKSGSLAAGTGRQLRDAAFSLYDQTAASGDTYLTANSKFNDKYDYSSSFQPESGVKLPLLGLTMEVVEQASDSTSANLFFKSVDSATIKALHNGLSIEFSINDPNALSNSTYLWQMGDNTELTGSGVNHRYAAAGRYTITVTYQTAVGDKTLTHEIVVGRQITANITTQVEDKLVRFNAKLSGGEGDFVYRWNFGDSNTSSQRDPEHTYDDYDTYNVTLSVTDETKQTFIFTDTVSLENILQTSFSQTVNNLQVTFTSTTTGGDENYSYAWDFGDNNTTSLAHPTHTYSSAGDYNITLVVTDGSGKTVESSTSVTVSAPIVSPPEVTKSNAKSGGSLGPFLVFLFGLFALSSRAKQA